eukprot:CAMPEP_0183553862 /NCGR_PEP_ID=MMETSP0371-20130417/76204_1 /TAXON_ID=268820 /ORGANISM="Peridinium aciculiferum, Strain PAER-2" /LENGTH=195 /DNA_ID=CAMNT_0025759505 /DNA_START=111 /DNA_END=698 /DNA_ORIENTATION=-
MSDPLLVLEVFKSYNSTKKVGPSFSMGIAPVVKDHVDKQGPGQYQVASTMDPKGNPCIPKHRGSQMGSGTLRAEDEPSPAPGDYSIEGFEKSGRIRKAPAYTCTGREAWIPRSEAPNPGPGEYKYELCAKNGKITPTKYSMASKLEPQEPARGSRRYVHPGVCYNPPGTEGAKNQHCATHKPPDYGFSKQPRGIL